MIVRKLSAEEMDHYLAPFKTIQSRKPVRQWPRESKDAIRNVFKDPDYLELIPSRTNAFPVLDIMISEEFNPETLLQA